MTPRHRHVCHGAPSDQGLAGQQLSPVLQVWARQRWRWAETPSSITPQSSTFTVCLGSIHRELSSFKLDLKAHELLFHKLVFLNKHQFTRSTTIFDAFFSFSYVYSAMAWLGSFFGTSALVSQWQRFDERT